MPRTLTASLILFGFAAALCGQAGKPAEPPDYRTPEVRDALLKLAALKPTDVLYDLGSGDGALAIAAAKTYGVHVVGIDLDAQRVRQANENARQAGVEKLVRFEENDMFEADLRAATVVTLFMLPDLNKRARPKLLRELKPGVRVVSHTSDMGGEWKPEKQLAVSGTTLYLWRVPSK